MQESTANKREQLISVPAVILLGVVIVMLLVLLFPRKGTFEDQRYIKNPDQLSIAYLKTILKLQPDNIPLRLTLAQQYIAISKWQQAKQLIDNFNFQNANDKVLADIINLQAHTIQYASTKKDDPARFKILAKTRDILARMDISHFNPAQLQTLAKIALSLNRPAIAANIYQQLASQDVKNPAKWWALAGKWARASSQNKLARLYYLNAYKASADKKTAAKYAGLSVITTIEANQQQLAVESLNEYLRVFPDNKYFLESIVAAYKALGDLQKAAHWNRLLWKRQGQNNEKIILNQIELELALAHLQHAKKYAHKLVLLRPGNNKYRKQLAQLYEWTGNPVAAQKQWQILANNTKSATAIKHVLRLAKANYDDSATLKMLALIARKRRLTNKERLQQIAIYKRQGQLKLAQTMLKKYLSLNQNDKKNWFQLAMLYENQNDYKAAIQVWHKIEILFPDDADAKNRQIKLHWYYQNHNKAYALATTLDNNLDNISNIDLLKILMELGWRNQDTDLLYNASKNLIKYDNKNEAAYKWLLSIADEKHDAEQAVALAETAWKNTGKTIYLYLALNTSVKENNTRLANYLITLALQSDISHREMSDYVQIKAELEDKNQNYALAAKYYEYALLLNPDSHSIHVGLLWSLLNSQQRKKLKRYLVAFKEKATRFSRYWPAYAAATFEIGEIRESVYWHAQIVALYPDNNLWLLSYADALEAAEQYNSALKLRLYVMKKIRATDIYSLLTNQPVKQLALSYLSLERNYGLGAKTNHMLKTLINHNRHSLPYEFLVAWYVTQNLDDKARYWHLSHQLSRQKIAASQFLTLALRENDTAVIKRTLDYKYAVSAVERNDGLIQLGQYEKALANSTAGMGLLSRQDERRAYREQAASLKAILPNDWLAETTQYSNGELRVSKVKAQLRSPFHNWNYAFTASKNKLDIAPSVVNLNGSNAEKELHLGVMRPGNIFNLYADLSYNQRHDKSILPLKLALDYKWSKRANFNLAWANNQLSTESSALRSLGMQDKLQVAINSDISNREYLNLQYAKTKYKSRWNETLANGWSADMSIGHRLSSGRNSWTIQADANWISNQLQSTLPPEVSQRLPVGTSVSTLVAAEFGTLGVSMRLNRGEIQSNYPQAGSLGYFGDIWIGQVFPTKDFAYRLSSGIAARIFGNDRLSLELYADQTKSKIGDQTSWGLSFSYRKFLGR